MFVNLFSRISVIVYELTNDRHKITIVNYLDVDKIYTDLFNKLGE